MKRIDVAIFMLFFSTVVSVFASLKGETNLYLLAMHIALLAIYFRI